MCYTHDTWYMGYDLRKLTLAAQGKNLINIEFIESSGRAPISSLSYGKTSGYFTAVEAHFRTRSELKPPQNNDHFLAVPTPGHCTFYP